MTRRTPTRRAAANEAAPKKAAPKEAASKKAASKEATSKKAASKKTAPKPATQKAPAGAAAAFQDATPLVALLGRKSTDDDVKALKSRGFLVRRPRPFPGDPQETRWELGRDLSVLAEDGVVVNVWLGFQWDGGLPGGLEHGMTQAQVRATLGPLVDETPWNDFFRIDGHRWRLTYTGDGRYMSMSIQMWEWAALLETRSRRHDALAAAKKKDA